MDLKEKIDLQRNSNDTFKLTQSELEEMTRGAREAFDIDRQKKDDIKAKQNEVEKTPGLATMIALNRVKADLPIEANVGKTNTEEFDLATVIKDDKRQKELAALDKQMLNPEKEAEKKLQAKDIDTKALAKDIEKNEIRDFFNQSYSGSDKSIIKVETGFKFSEPHEWREFEMKKNSNANNIYSDRNLKSVEYAGAKNMADTHKREMKDSMSDTRPALEAQHKVEKSLFELQHNRFEMETKEGQDISVLDVHKAHAATMNDFAEYKALKTKLPLENKIDMKSQYHQVDVLAHKPAVQAPKEEIKNLWAGVDVSKHTVAKQGLQMKMTQH